MTDHRSEAIELLGKAGTLGPAAENMLLRALIHAVLSLGDEKAPRMRRRG